MCQFLCDCNHCSSPTFVRVVDACQDLIVFADHAHDAINMETSTLYRIINESSPLRYIVAWDKSGHTLQLGTMVDPSSLKHMCISMKCNKFLRCDGLRVEIDSSNDIVSMITTEPGRSWYGYIAIGSREFQLAVYDFVYHSEELLMRYSFDINERVHMTVFLANFTQYGFPIEAAWNAFLLMCKHVYKVSYKYGKTRITESKLCFGKHEEPSTNTFRYFSQCDNQNPLPYNTAFVEVQEGFEDFVTGPLIDVFPEIREHSIERTRAQLLDKRK